MTYLALWPATSSGLMEDYTGAFDQTPGQAWSEPWLGLDPSLQSSKRPSAEVAGAPGFDFDQIFTPFSNIFGFNTTPPITVPIPRRFRFFVAHIDPKL